MAQRPVRHRNRAEDVVQLLQALHGLARSAEVAATQAPLPQGRICQQSMEYVYARYLNE